MFLAIVFDTVGSMRSGRVFCGVWRVGFQTPFVTCRNCRSGCFAKNTLDCGRRNAVPFCDLSNALAALTILLYGGTVQY